MHRYPLDCLEAGPRAPTAQHALHKRASGAYFALRGAHALADGPSISGIVHGAGIDGRPPWRDRERCGGNIMRVP